VHDAVGLPNERLWGAARRRDRLQGRHGLRQRRVRRAPPRVGCLWRATIERRDLFPRPGLFERRVPGNQPRAACVRRPYS
jgi:hypothetical protein